MPLSKHDVPALVHAVAQRITDKRDNGSLEVDQALEQLDFRGTRAREDYPEQHPGQELL